MHVCFKITDMVMLLGNNYVGNFLKVFHLKKNLKCLNANSSMLFFMELHFSSSKLS